MILETPRLWLRDFTADDWPAVLAYQRDPRYLQYNPWTERSEADVRAFVQMFLDQQTVQPRTHFQLALIHKGDNQLIGNCGIRINDPEAGEANIGYELDSRYWRQGLATEAARCILQFGFETLKLHRIWAECVAANGASARVLSKIGMRQEGRLREKEYLKGVWHDHLLFAILRSEWSASTA